MASSVDPDQTPQNAASDLVYTVCSGLTVPILRVITVKYVGAKALRLTRLVFWICDIGLCQYVNCLNPYDTHLAN